MGIVDLYNDKGLRRYATKLTGSVNDSEDLFSHCIEICLKSPDKLDGVIKRNKLRQYFIVMLKFQHYKRVKKNRDFLEVEESMVVDNPFQDEEERIHEEEKGIRVQSALESMHFFTSGLLKLYADNSYRDIAAKTKIPYVSVSRGVNAAKTEFMKIYYGTKIALILQTISGVEYHRLIVPLLKMQSKYNCELLVFKANEPGNEGDKWLNKIPPGTTHAIFSRNISSMLSPELVISKLKLRDIKVICDVDDYWNLPKGHIDKEVYKATNMSKCIQSNIQLADVVWTTTGRLADEIKKINKNVFVVKNCLDMEEGQFNVKPSKKGNFDKFIWSGGTTHQADLALIREAVQDVEFTIKGHIPEQTYMAEWFPNAKLLPPSDLNTYADEMKNHRIALIPLVNNKFNSMKSELKLIEAGTLGRAVICSDVHPYKPHLKRFKNCLKSSNNDWPRWVQRIKGEHQMQMDLGMALNEYVRENYKLEVENKLRFDTL